MNGKVIVSGMLLTAVVAGVGLWYSIEQAYYLEVTGVTEVTAYGDAFPVSEYQGIDADTSPLKMRACFKVDWDYFPTDEYKDKATPLRAPRFFKCFDAGQMTDDLQSGAATAILADENHPYGFDTYITQYPDGRAFMWRQINKCGDAQFGGNDLPAGCPDPDSMDQDAALMPSTPDELAVAAVETLAQLAPTNATIALLPYGAAQAELISVSDLRAVATPTDPLTFYSCFKTPLSYGLLTETYQTYETPNPQTTSFGCFNAAQIRADLNSGAALAFVGEKNIEPGIAVYDDGRAYAWHQKAKSE